MLIFDEIISLSAHRDIAESTAKQGIPSKSTEVEQEFARLTHKRDTHDHSCSRQRAVSPIDTRARVIPMAWCESAAHQFNGYPQVQETPQGRIADQRAQRKPSILSDRRKCRRLVVEYLNRRVGQAAIRTCIRNGGSFTPKDRGLAGSNVGATRR